MVFNGLKVYIQTSQIDAGVRRHLNVRWEIKNNQFYGLSIILSKTL